MSNRVLTTEDVISEFNRPYPFEVEEGLDAAKVKRVTAKMLPFIQKENPTLKYKVILHDCPAPNFAKANCIFFGKVPYITILIHENFMKYVKCDDTLAGIIGHEAGHAIFKFGINLREIKELEEPKTTKDLHEEEFFCDRKSIELMVLAGYNPYAYIHYFQTSFYAKGGKIVDDKDLTHPFTFKRTIRMREQIAQYGNTIDAYWERNLKTLLQPQ